MRRCAAASILLALTLSVIVSPGAAVSAPRYAGGPPPPHIIYILTDDAGYGTWPSVYIKTPAIDALAAEGLRLPEFYSFQFCSPSRASALTGRWPWRTPNARINFLPSYVMDGTPLEYNMLPKRLAAASYVSYMAGKWHQGLFSPSYLPLARGFDHFDGFLSGGEDHFSQAADLSVGDCNVTGAAIRDAWQQNGTAPAALGEYTATRFTRSAVDWLRGHAARYGARPAFLYLALHNTHAPLQALPQFEALYANISFAPRRSYYAMMSTVDDTVRNVTAALKEAGLWNSSLVIWHTDNGTPVQVGGSNWPLRGGKGSNWEGGVRVPALVSGGWLPPARRGLVAPAGARAHMVDLYATIRAAAGLPAADGELPAPIDSLDLGPFLRGEAASTPRADAGGAALVLDHNAFAAPPALPHGALISGGYKLLVGPRGGEAQASWYGVFSPNASAPAPSLAFYACAQDAPPGGCLFDLRTDPQERVDLAAAQPTVFAQLMAQFQALNSSYHPPRENPPSDEAGLCALALQNDRIVAPWKPPVQAAEGGGVW